MNKLVITPQIEEVLTLVTVNSQLVSLKLLLQECLGDDMYAGDASRELMEEAFNDVCASIDKLRDIFDELTDINEDK